jgi:HTH-like domain
VWAPGPGECAAKKSVGQARLEQRHAVIEDACQEQLPISIRQLCELLQVNRAWYYARQHVIVEPSKGIEAVALRDAIEASILEFSGYGYRRVTHALHRAGWKVNHKRVLRIMREESLLCHLKRHFVQTTDSHHPYPVYPNLVNGRTPDAPDVSWVADLTSIRLHSECVAPFDDPGCLLTEMCRVELVDPYGFAVDARRSGRGTRHT